MEVEAVMENMRDFSVNVPGLSVSRSASSLEGCADFPAKTRFFSDSAYHAMDAAACFTIPSGHPQTGYPPIGLIAQSTARWFLSRQDETSNPNAFQKPP
jgi:hypothetical protein